MGNENVIENVVENAEPVVKANKVDVKGAAVIFGVATVLVALTTFVVKTIREKTASKTEETEDNEPEIIGTEAQA